MGAQEMEELKSIVADIDDRVRRAEEAECGDHIKQWRGNTKNAENQQQAEKYTDKYAARREKEKKS